MIYEYALEPALVIDWVISKVAVYAREFGLDKRRLVSDFPKNWEGHVYGELYKHFNNDNTSLEFQNAALDLRYYLQILTEYMVYRDSKVLSDDWFNMVILEHNIRPFYGIFSSKNNSICSSKDVFTEKDINDIKNQKLRWFIPTVDPTRKSATEIAAILRPLLQASREIHIVDPYFDFDQNRPRFEKTLIEIIHQTVKEPRAVKCTPSIEIITGVERDNRKGEETTDEQAKIFANNIHKRAIENLPKKIVNYNISIQLTILKNIPGIDPLHNRFILTDIGGVIFPFGTDDYDRNPDHIPTDDLMPMTKGIYEARWNQYVKKLRKENVVLKEVLKSSYKK